MTNKRSISIDNKLYLDIKEYCKLNNINILQYCNNLLKESFYKNKFGDIPFGVFISDEIETNEKDIIEPDLVINEDLKQEVKETKEQETIPEPHKIITTKRRLK